MARDYSVPDKESDNSIGIITIVQDEVVDTTIYDFKKFLGIKANVYTYDDMKYKNDIPNKNKIILLDTRNISSEDLNMYLRAIEMNFPRQRAKFIAILLDDESKKVIDNFDIESFDETDEIINLQDFIRSKLEEISDQGSESFIESKRSLNILCIGGSGGCGTTAISTSIAAYLSLNSDNKVLYVSYQSNNLSSIEHLKINQETYKDHCDNITKRKNNISPSQHIIGTSIDSLYALIPKYEEGLSNVDIILRTTEIFNQVKNKFTCVIHDFSSFQFNYLFSDKNYEQTVGNFDRIFLISDASLVSENSAYEYYEDILRKQLKYKKHINLYPIVNRTGLFKSLSFTKSIRDQMYSKYSSIAYSNSYNRDLFLKNMPLKKIYLSNSVFINSISKILASELGIYLKASKNSIKSLFSSFRK